MDCYQIVTDKIVNLLEEGTVPWHKPWAGGPNGAFNRVTGRKYSFLNQMLLKHDGEYASLQQWNKLGGKIGRGQKSELVTFFKMTEVAEGETDENGEPVKPRPVLRYYNVFHISQVEGVEPLEQPKLNDGLEPDERAERILRNYLDIEGVKFEQEYSSEAYYSPSADTIHVPLLSQFQEASEYYSTVFHESVHSTGSHGRLNRIGLQKASFGSETYSKEELIAEIGSAYLMKAAGIDTENSIENSTAYIQGWLNALKNDRRLIVSAAGQAERAAKFILDDSQFGIKMSTT